MVLFKHALDPLSEIPDFEREILESWNPVFMEALMSFWGELKRRNVFKVGAAYVIVAWLIVQVANTFFPILHLPEWIVTLVAFLLILGFPVALIHAWAYEVTPDGIKKTKEVPLAESITHLTGKKLNFILTGLLVIAVGYIVIDKVFISRRSIETEVIPPVAEQVAPATEVKEEPKTIAVLPFDDLSPEKDQEYFVLGLSEEILNYLSKITSLHVTSKTSSFTFKDSDKTIQEIAGILEVAHILEGSVRKAGDALRITAQLIHVADDRHIWSETYDRELKDIFDVQKDIATSIADELQVTLGVEESFEQIGGTGNVEAYELYLMAQGQINDDKADMALELLDAAIALDPNFALAWAAKAYCYSNIGTDVPGNQAVLMREAALNAAMKTIELEPKLSSGYFCLGMVKTAYGHIIEAEKTFRMAFKRSTEQPLWASIGTLSRHYALVGNFEKADEHFREMLQYDPLNQFLRAHYIINLGFMGEIQKAEEENERCEVLFGASWNNVGGWAITDLRLGAKDIILRSDILISTKIYDVLKDHLDSPEGGIEALLNFYKDEDNLSSRDCTAMAVTAAYFNDPGLALDALEKGFHLSADGLFHVWLPVMHKVRQLPRFKEFAWEIGLVDYWNEFGWPEICQPTNNGSFVCD